ncbi:MAG TPA: hypothetical protein VHM19_13525 [Polyangiales bacterium]|nr:hypothetical protein [Polyangiales bacterium]
MSEGVLPPKRDVAKALLRKGSLFVHLDPRVEGVSVPSWLTQQPQLVLQVGFDMVIPIPDLRVDEQGVFGTLSFSRNPFACNVPWDAVFALVGDDGRGLVWPESMPPEIAAEVEREAQRARRATEDRLRSTEPAREMVLHAAPQPSAAVRHSDDLSVASLVNTHRAEAPALKQQRPVQRSRKPKSLPPYLRVVK